jgi:DNA repair exonuclease SbcCD ATPase subunit
MATKTTAKSKKKAAAPADNPATKQSSSEDIPQVSGGSSNLDKVRDLLFGEEVQLLTAQQKQLEEKLSRMIEDLGAQTSSRISELENMLSNRLDNVAADLDSEGKLRGQEDKGLSQQLGEARESIEELEAQTANKLADLYDQLMGECDRLQKEADKLGANLENASQHLTADKADRTTLANLLKSMAASLENES